jgi:hypothetical protein
MIPTAEEFLKSKGLGGYQQFDGMLQEFAKLHCIEQARVISDNVEVIVDSSDIFQAVDKYSILNAYPLDLIK